MASIFGLPLVMASVFTLGCILIPKAGRRADAVTEGLGFVFLLCVLLNAIALLAVFGRPRTVDPALGTTASAPPSGAAELAARPILPATHTNEGLKTNANFWNAPCLPQTQERREVLACR